jgi:hypothetical protein
MRIKAVCKKHPDAAVMLLEATTKYKNAFGNYVDESTERATFVELDEANLYCTARPRLVQEAHDVGFEVVEDGWIHDDRSKS